MGCREGARWPFLRGYPTKLTNLGALPDISRSLTPFLRWKTTILAMAADDVRMAVLRCYATKADNLVALHDKKGSFGDSTRQNEAISR